MCKPFHRAISAKKIHKYTLLSISQMLLSHIFLNPMLHSFAGINQFLMFKAGANTIPSLSACPLLV